MLKLDYKELANPFILLPLIVLVSYIMGIRGADVLIYAFMIFLIFSIINNLFLVVLGIVKKRLYAYVYGAFLFYLILLIPLFYLIDFSRPILYSFFVLGVTDFIVQGFYNITKRKDGKGIIEEWEDKLIKSERVWFHPVSLQKYKFKDFTVSITDSRAVNPTNLHITHLHPLEYGRIPHHIYKHQYGRKAAYLFHLYLKKSRIKDENQTIKGLKVNKGLLNSLKKRDKEVGGHIITAYRQGSSTKKMDLKNPFTRNESARKKGSNDIRIVIEKQYVRQNPDKIYDFLKKCNDLKT